MHATGQAVMSCRQQLGALLQECLQPRQQHESHQTKRLVLLASSCADLAWAPEGIDRGT